MKRLIAAALSAALVLGTAQAAFAADVRLSTQNLAVDGTAVNCEKYNIDGNNYFKLRDVAAALDGTENGFSVDYDSVSKSVVIVPGEKYVSDGSENAAGGDKSSTARISSQKIVIGDETISGLKVYNIGGNNYFKLRELGDLLGFAVSYDEATRTAVVKTVGSSSGSGPAPIVFNNTPYDIVSGYDAATETFMTTLDTSLPLMVTYNVPYVKSSVPAYKVINSYLARKVRDFWSADNEQLQDVLEWASIYQEESEDSKIYNYEFLHPCSIEYYKDYVSVVVQYDWWMGGVNDYGADCMIFDAKTGKQLTLRDFYGPDEALSDRDVVKKVIEALKVEDNGTGNITFDYVKEYKPEDFDIFIDDGALCVWFDKYEVSYGAYGEVVLKLKDL